MFVVFILLSVACSNNTSHIQDFISQSNSEYPILVVGDSLSAGYMLSNDSSWVSLLEIELKEQQWIRSSQSIANVSVSGQTSKDALKSLSQDLATYKPSLIIIQLGANDALRRQSMNDLRNNLAQAIELSKASNAKVLLVGVNLPSKFFFVSTKSFTSIYKDLSKEHDIYLLENLLMDVNSNSALMLEDNLHPNEAGQRVILKNVLDKLERL